jgi:hypothetical protein
VKQQMMCRIVLDAAPAGVDFALQQGRGSKFELVQTQRATTADLRFDVRMSIRDTDEAEPDFRGAAVQGPRGQRFIYVNSGVYAGQADTKWARRLTVPLVGITRAMVERLLADPRSVLEARVPGSARDGAPNAATAEQFTGWKLTRAR